jgi:hypothetical protein
MNHIGGNSLLQLLTGNGSMAIRKQSAAQPNRKQKEVSDLRFHGLYQRVVFIV